MSVIVLPKLSMKFDPDPWNHPDVIGRNNCLAYALDEFGLGWPFENFRAAFNPTLHCLRDEFLGYPESQKIKDKNYIMMLFYLAGFEIIRPHQYAPSERHIIAFRIERGHYYRLDGDKIWSHKPGMSEVSNRDDNGNVIKCLEDTVIQHSTLNRVDDEFIYLAMPQVGIEITPKV